jgi:hypothetical protein
VVTIREGQRLWAAGKRCAHHKRSVFSTKVLCPTFQHQLKDDDPQAKEKRGSIWGTALDSAGRWAVKLVLF